MKNLFDNPTTLRDPRYFVGRKEQVERILGLIKARQSVSLVGPRRIGKTSLLTYLRSSLIEPVFDFDNNRLLFLYLDLQKRPPKTQVDFFTDVHRTLKNHAQTQGYALRAGLEKDDEFEALLDEFQQRRLHPVLMMDTFDKIVQYQPIDESIFGFLRSEGSEGRLSYITASVELLGEIFRKLFPVNPHESPFYNIFATTLLKSFSPEEAQTMLVDLSTASGLPFTSEEVSWVLHMAGTHPFLLQQVATLLFQEKQIHRSGKPDYEHIRKEAQQSLYSHFEDCWTMLQDSEQHLLGKHIAQIENGEQQKPHDCRIYPELCAGRLFRAHLQETGRLAGAAPLQKPVHVDLSVSDFKRILDDSENLAFLGESPLANLPVIAARLAQQQNGSPTLRGQVVYTVLKEALELLGGEGTRIDEADDWLHYNILYYRYFKRNRHLNQNQIARRLSISERQYYRFLPKSLERLWKALLTMDTSLPLESGT